MKRFGLWLFVLLSNNGIVDRSSADSNGVAHLLSGEEAHEGRSCTMAVLADELVLEIPTSFGLSCVRDFIRSITDCSQWGHPTGGSRRSYTPSPGALSV